VLLDSLATGDAFRANFYNTPPSSKSNPTLVIALPNLTLIISFLAEEGTDYTQFTYDQKRYSASTVFPLNSDRRRL
jgi:hypothetical protein